MTKREQRLQAIAAEAAEWRHDLHRNPGTAFEETFASEFVSKKLTEWGIAHERGIAGTGVVATIEGQRNHSGRKSNPKVNRVIAVSTAGKWIGQHGN